MGSSCSAASPNPNPNPNPDPNPNPNQALNNVCYGDDGAAHARKRRATQAGGREVAIAAMQAHPADYEVRWFGQRLLNRLQEGAGGHGTTLSPVLSRGFSRWQSVF